jgi:shikimate kinase
MGVGKSTAGVEVAELTGRRFVDLDDEVEAVAGASIRSMIDAGDEAGFRNLEAQVLATLLASQEPLVVATGGGAVLDETTRGLLAGGPVVVWLKAAVSTLVTRLDPAALQQRPLLDGGPETVLTRLESERSPLYAEVADITIDVDADTPASVASAVLAALSVDSPLVSGESSDAGEPSVLNDTEPLP